MPLNADSGNWKTCPEEKFTSPHQKERSQLNTLQAEIKASPSRTIQSLDLAGRFDFVNHLHDKMIRAWGKQHGVLQQLQHDAKIMHRFLTPGVLISSDAAGEKKETSYDYTQFESLPPGLIFIMGNNDLRQIDFIASLYLSLPLRKRPKIIVSGFGGHGTMHDPVFGRTEAGTMICRLKNLGVSRNDIIAEYDAVDTGRNIKYFDTLILLNYVLNNFAFALRRSDLAFLKKMWPRASKPHRTAEEDERLDNILAPFKNDLIANKTVIHPHVLISGTPGGLLRQLRSFEQQTSLPFNRISCLTPHEFAINRYTKNYYYETLPKALINFIYGLREISTYLKYAVNSDYISIRKIRDEKILKEAISLLANYYNLMRPEKINISQLIMDFIAYSKFKHEAIINKPLQDKLLKIILPIADYYRRAFLDVEIVWLKQLKTTLTAKEQMEVLDSGGVYRKYGPLFRAAPIVEEKPETFKIIITPP